MRASAPTRTEQERKGADAAERAGAEQPNEKAAETGGPFHPLTRIPATRASGSGWALHCGYAALAKTGPSRQDPGSWGDPDVHGDPHSFSSSTFAIPPQGTLRTSPRLGTHDDHRLTTMLICGRSHLRRRLGIGRGAQPAAIHNRAPRRECAGSEPDRKAESVERRHPSERGGPGHREAGTPGGRSERGAAARDFRCASAPSQNDRPLRAIGSSVEVDRKRPS